LLSKGRIHTKQPKDGGDVHGLSGGKISHKKLSNA
jgi:hypothetical protein